MSVIEVYINFCMSSRACVCVCVNTPHISECMGERETSVDDEHFLLLQLLPIEASQMCECVQGRAAAPHSHSALWVLSLRHSKIPSRQNLTPELQYNRHIWASVPPSP